MIPSYSDLQYFLELSECLNFSRASERLGLSQPTLSQAIKRLEGGLQTDLFIRTHHKLVITSAGEKLRIESQKLLNQWAQVSSSVTNTTQKKAGTFNIGMHPSVALYSLKHFAKNILKEKQISFNLSHGLSREMTEMIVSRKLDVALIINPVRHPDLVLKKLAEDKVTFWKNKSTDTNTLIYDPALTQSQTLLKEYEYQFKRKIPSSNLETIQDLCSLGAGVGLLPERIAQKDPALKQVSKSPSFKDELYMAYRVDHEKNPGFEHVLQCIRTAKI